MIDCPVYQAQLKYDIEHIDEIEDVVYRISLKNKLGIPRNEKDQKDLDDYLADLKKAKEILNMRPEDTLATYVDAELKDTEIRRKYGSRKSQRDSKLFERIGKGKKVKECNSVQTRFFKHAHCSRR